MSFLEIISNNHQFPKILNGVVIPVAHMARTKVREGVGMELFLIRGKLCDWKTVSLRHADCGEPVFCHCLCCGRIFLVRHRRRSNIECVCRNYHAIPDPFNCTENMIWCCAKEKLALWEEILLLHNHYLVRVVPGLRHISVWDSTLVVCFPLKGASKKPLNRLSCFGLTAFKLFFKKNL